LLFATRVLLEKSKEIVYPILFPLIPVKGKRRKQKKTTFSKKASILLLAEKKKMHIRRLRLDDDDDDEYAADEAVQPQPQPQTVTHQTENSTNFPSPPVEISDDDFIDISDDLVTPPPIPEPQPSDCPVNDFLRRLGFGLMRDSLATCLRELGDSVNGFQGFDVATKAKLCFEQFLFSDLNFCGSAVLPPNVESMHLDVLPGPYVLQVLISLRSTIKLISYILHFIIMIIMI
jgi:hypothetical protein